MTREKHQKPLHSFLVLQFDFLDIALSASLSGQVQTWLGCGKIANCWYHVQTLQATSIASARVAYWRETSVYLDNAWSERFLKQSIIGIMSWCPLLTSRLRGLGRLIFHLIIKDIISILWLNMCKYSIFHSNPLGIKDSCGKLWKTDPFLEDLLMKIGGFPWLGPPPWAWRHWTQPFKGDTGDTRIFLKHDILQHACHCKHGSWMLMVIPYPWRPRNPRNYTCCCNGSRSPTASQKTIKIENPLLRYSYRKINSGTTQKNDWVSRVNWSFC